MRSLLFCCVLWTLAYVDAHVSPLLCSRINALREHHHVEPLQLSTAMMVAAETHSRDLNAATPPWNTSCNLHSWQDNAPYYSGCCFTNDFAHLSCMLDKPRQLTTWYHDKGFEVAAYGCLSVDCVVRAWTASRNHLRALLDTSFTVIGCAFSPRRASLCWMGRTLDPRPFAECMPPIVPIPHERIAPHPKYPPCSVTTTSTLTPPPYTSSTSTSTTFARTTSYTQSTRAASSTTHASSSSFASTSSSRRRNTTTPSPLSTTTAKSTVRSLTATTLASVIQPTSIVPNENHTSGSSSILSALTCFRPWHTIVSLLAVVSVIVNT